MTISRKLGIGITTFNRRGMLLRCIERVRRHTKQPFEIFVSDDGSTDKTDELLSLAQVTYCSPANRGIAWNKNRVLYYLHEVAKCDWIITLEDDTFPVEDRWEEDWITAIELYGHVNLSPSHWVVEHAGGSGSPRDPFLGAALTGQCAGFSREAISLVGFFDTRFKHYGFEHVEHTERLLRAGFGGELTQSGKLLPFLIKSPLKVEGLDKPPDAEGMLVSGPVYNSLQGEEVRRPPWRGDEEMIIFRSELAAIKGPKLRSAESAPQLAYLLSSTFENIFYLDGEITIHPQRSSPLRAGIALLGRTAYLFIKTETDHWISAWLKANSVSPFWEVVDKESATPFEVEYRKDAGLGLRAFKSFLCCDYITGGKISLSRPTLSDWETFRLSDYSQNLELKRRNPLAYPTLVSDPPVIRVGD